MRLFVAVELPEEVKEELVRAQGMLPKAKMKLVGKDQMHLTLKFLGEVTPAKAEKVKEGLGKIKFRPFKTCLSGVGIFPSESHIRVVWVGLEPDDEMVALQKKVDSALENEFPKDKQFKAHLTLARVKFVGDKKGFVHELERMSVNKLCFEVSSFNLKKSILAREEPIYEDLASF